MDKERIEFVVRGSIDLSGKTLTEAERLIREIADKARECGEAHVTMKIPRIANVKL
jgi:SpoVK/Ycf46/Vps4 family AAA+-type ATPase